MMRLPHFSYHAPKSVADAAEILSSEGPQAMLLAGGTDLLPNMKRRQQVPTTVIGLRDVQELRQITNGSGLSLGAGLSLTDLVRAPKVRADYPGLWQAASQVATVHLRNMGTLGGNLCLDTRCSYYDQSYEWRKAIDFCMKKDGEICWVATKSKRCLAISSTDTAPALISLGAKVRLVSASEQREVRLEDLYQDDGIDFMHRRPDEILTEVILEPTDGVRSTYWKLRRRGSFDFPVLSVAAAVKLAGDGSVEHASVVLGAVASQPRVCTDAAQFLIGKQLSDEVIEETGKLAAKRGKPMDNADFTVHWRKRVANSFVGYALRELRGDDMSEIRMRVSKHDPSAIVA
jgi:4-hydroxybenzoyl-CoA reductase subunit beta